MMNRREYLDALKAHRAKLVETDRLRKTISTGVELPERPRQLDDQWRDMTEDDRRSIATDHNAECTGDGVSLVRRDDGHWFFVRDGETP